MTSGQQYLEFAPGKWTFTAKGPYTGRLDRRELYNVRHDWIPAETGNFGQIETEATIPQGWKPPFALHFYAGDDYVSNLSRLADDAWLGQECYIGHRFKQVLIDDQVVWEIDAGDNGAPNFAVNITPYVTPGRPFRLALRVLDKVGTDQVLPDDYLHVGTTEGDKSPDSPRKFQTNVWWGDVVIRGQDNAKTPLKPRPLPPANRLAIPPPGSFPLPPLDLPWKEPIVLPLDTADLPPDGFPITCGVPLPYGSMNELTGVGLKDSSGNPVAAQLEVMNRWPDGSIRWVLVDLIAKPRAAPYTLALKSAPAAKPAGVRVSSRNGSVTLNTGAIVLDFGVADSVLVESISLKGESQPVAERLSGEMIVVGPDGDEQVRAIREKIKVKARGPVRAEVEVHGRLASEKRTIGRFVLRLAAYAGLPLVRVFYRVFNDTDETLKIKEIDLNLPVSLGSKARAEWTDSSGKLEADAGRGFMLSQPGTDEWMLEGVSKNAKPGAKASGWFGFSDDRRSVQVCVRRFWQQCPKSMGLNDGTVKIGLCSSAGDAPVFEQTVGEAKRHEIWLSFGPRVNRGPLANCMLNPPRLFSPDYVAAVGALGPCYPRTGGEFKEFGEFVRTAYGAGQTEDIGYGYGIRNFGDGIFSAENNQWRNNYYDNMLETFAEYRMTGDRRWFDRGEETARHVMDVDQCHHDSDPGQVGGIYMYSSPGHTHGGFWDAMLRQGAGFAVYYRLTGDPDARQALVELADFIVRNKRGLKPQESKRDYGGLMETMVWAYDETGNTKYLRHCRRILEAVLDQKRKDPAGTYVDARRGTFMEIHGNVNYRGNVPWMLAQLAEPLYGYYRFTGDPDAAMALVGFAESVTCENMTPDVPGDFHGYSHNPHYGKSSTYHMLVGPMMMYAFDLTGDDYFLTCARAAYEQSLSVLKEKPRTIIFWNVPTLLYFLHLDGVTTRLSAQSQ